MKIYTSLFKLLRIVDADRNSQCALYMACLRILKMRFMLFAIERNSLYDLLMMLWRSMWKQAWHSTLFDGLFSKFLFIIIGIEQLKKIHLWNYCFWNVSFSCFEKKEFKIRLVVRSSWHMRTRGTNGEWNVWKILHEFQ